MLHFIIGPILVWLLVAIARKAGEFIEERRHGPEGRKTRQAVIEAMPKIWSSEPEWTKRVVFPQPMHIWLLRQYASQARAARSQLNGLEWVEKRRGETVTHYSVEEIPLPRFNSRWVRGWVYFVNDGDTQPVNHSITIALDGSAGSDVEIRLRAEKALEMLGVMVHRLHSASGYYSSVWVHRDIGDHRQYAHLTWCGFGHPLVSLSTTGACLSDVPIREIPAARIIRGANRVILASELLGEASGSIKAGVKSANKSSKRLEIVLSNDGLGVFPLDNNPANKHPMVVFGDKSCRGWMHYSYKDERLHIGDAIGKDQQRLSGFLAGLGLEGEIKLQLSDESAEIQLQKKCSLLGDTNTGVVR